MAFGVCTNCLNSFPPSAGQKWNFAKLFFDIVITHKAEICYVKHVLAPLNVFSPYLGVGGGVPRGLGHHLLMQF